jgi:hypothetical protein
VDHRGDAVTVPCAHFVECNPDRFVRPEVYVDRRCGRRRVWRTGTIQANNGVAFPEPGDQRGGDEAARARGQNDVAVGLAAAGFTALDIGHDLLPSFVHL